MRSCENIMMLALVLFFSSSLALANNCRGENQPPAVQKYLLLKTVQATEKQKVSDVEITAPGLAIVTYGEALRAHKVRVVFQFDCTDQFTPEQLIANPTGFRVLDYK